MGDKIFVTLFKGYGRAIEGLGEITDDAGDFVSAPRDFKLVLFTGGQDISPCLYGEKGAKSYHIYERDLSEARIHNIAKEQSIKMAGICRGAQFLNVMAGGRMMHHIENHTGCSHYVETCRNELILVNSLHHQMIVPNDNVHVIGWSKYKLSPIYFGKHDKKEDWKGPETEAIVIPSTLACGVQWHPETMNKGSDGYQFFYNMVENLLIMDINDFTAEYTGKKARVAKREV